jgi:hypothetical protein
MLGGDDGIASLPGRRNSATIFPKNESVEEGLQSSGVSAGGVRKIE